MLSSYNGYPASPVPSAIGIKPFSIAGRSFPGGVKGGAVTTVFKYYAAQYHLRVESLGLGSASDEWGYSYRQNRNADNLSCHASGTALDFNATLHPNGKAHTLSSQQVATLRVIQAEVGHVIKWGGDFSVTKDEMHHEIHGTPDQVTAVAAHLLTCAWWHRNLYLTGTSAKTWLRGDDVKHLQAHLHITDDGVFGPDTATAFKRMEARLHLPVTGNCTKARAFFVG